MQLPIETPRLILREMLPTDAEGMFELDVNPEVHRYLGNHPVTDIQQSRDIIDAVRRQYEENGIGRWAAIEKSSGAFIGWAGLKLIKEPLNNHVDFYDVGYRLIPRFWGKGYATEAAKASLEYAFTHLPTDVVYALAHVDNAGSKNVLQKCGLVILENFMLEDMMVAWLRITREEWSQRS